MLQAWLSPSTYSSIPPIGPEKRVARAELVEAMTPPSLTTTPNRAVAPPEPRITPTNATALLVDPEEEVLAVTVPANFLEIEILAEA